MIGTTDGSGATPTWEDTLPHFSVTEKGDRITAAPLDAEGVFGLVATLTFVAWVPVSVGSALFFDGASRGDVTSWHYVVVIFYSFLPMLLTDLTVDEGRDRFGRRSTARSVAAIPMFTGLAVGFLIAWVWTGGSRGGWVGAVTALCAAAAVAATVAAWWRIGYTRRRQVWMASLRRDGQRVPGLLREVTFLRQWADSNPLFRVVVEYTGSTGPQVVTANMVTTTRRVPRPGVPVLVTYSSQDPAAEPLIELDHTADLQFDPDHAEYTQPSVN